jgi:uncharacterized protein (TIGR02266 family)
MTRILLVDDVELFLELERTFLKRTGCQILTATSGEEALAKARSLPPDAVLLDVVMPDMSGYDVCRQMRREPRLEHVPVIFVAADPDPAEVERCGAQACLTKPVTRQQLLETLRPHVRLAERAAPRAAAVFRVQMQGEGHRARKVTSKDLSQDGIFLKMERPLAVGSHVSLRFRVPLPGGLEDVELQGEVVRRVEEEHGSYLIPGMGIRFVGSEPRARRAVGRFLRSRLTAAV